MRSCAIKIFILSTFVGIITSSAAGQEFNVKELLKMQESEDGSSNSRILVELRSLICGLDSLLAEVRRPAERQWKRDIFKPLVTIRAGTGTGPGIASKSERESIPLILTGTAVSGNRAIAIFGRIEVGTGDVIDGYRVISIEIGRVIVESENGSREILIINGEK
ncbi:MAG: hypothetical protein KOO63_16300 [Bacteroidales bacterium]|nr:hypothetical protein [Candidatus Latescibacterota bacterium]